MAQRAPKGSMKQVSRPILIYLSPRSPNSNHQQPLKNDLHFGGLLRGMLRGYASRYASGVCFARAPPSTNTYLGPREKNTNPYRHVYKCMPWQCWEWTITFLRGSSSLCPCKKMGEALEICFIEYSMLS